MYGKFTHIWLIFMVTVGKYTVRPMDPMAHVSLVCFGYTYSTFLCVAFSSSKPQLLAKTNQLQKLHYPNPIPNEPKMGPLFWREFRPCFGGGLHLQTYTFKPFQDIGALGISYLTHHWCICWKMFIQVSPASTPATATNIHTPHMLSVVRSSTSTWRRRNSAKTGLGTNCDHVTMWHPCWDSPGKKHSIPWDGLTLIDLHMDLMISEWVQIFHSRNFCAWKNRLNYVYWNRILVFKSFLAKFQLPQQKNNRPQHSPSIISTTRWAQEFQL